MDRKSSVLNHKYGGKKFDSIIPVISTNKNFQTFLIASALKKKNYMAFQPIKVPAVLSCRADLIDNNYLILILYFFLS